MNPRREAPGSVRGVCLSCQPRRKSLWLAKSWPNHGTRATADGSPGFVWAAITKRTSGNTTIERSTVPMREAQTYLTKRLRERDLGRDLEGAKITLNEYLDRWLETSVRPRVREKTCQDYEGMLRRYVRPSLGERLLTAHRVLWTSKPADDGTWPVCADAPLHARCVEIRDAAAVDLASISCESVGW